MANSKAPEGLTKAVDRALAERDKARSHEKFFRNWLNTRSAILYGVSLGINLYAGASEWASGQAFFSEFWQDTFLFTAIGVNFLGFAGAWVADKEEHSANRHAIKLLEIYAPESAAQEAKQDFDAARDNAQKEKGVRWIRGGTFALALVAALAHLSTDDFFSQTHVEFTDTAKSLWDNTTLVAATAFSFYNAWLNKSIVKYDQEETIANDRGIQKLRQSIVGATP